MAYFTVYLRYCLFFMPIKVLPCLSFPRYLKMEVLSSSNLFFFQAKHTHRARTFIFKGHPLPWISTNLPNYENESSQTSRKYRSPLTWLDFKTDDVGNFGIISYMYLMKQLIRMAWKACQNQVDWYSLVSSGKNVQFEHSISLRTAFSGNKNPFPNWWEEEEKAQQQFTQAERLH